MTAEESKQPPTRAKPWNPNLDWDFLHFQNCRTSGSCPFGRASLEVIPTPQCRKAEGCWRSIAKMSGSIWSCMSNFILFFSPKLHQHHIRFTWNFCILAFSCFRLSQVAHATDPVVVKFRWLHWILQYRSGLETSGFSVKLQTWHSPIPS